MRTLSPDVRGGAPTFGSVVSGLFLWGIVGASPSAALPREMVRDFPVSYCPVHSGRSVNEAGDDLIAGSPIRVRPELTFTATGTSMVVTFSSCSGGSVLQPQAEIGVDNFTVVRSSVYLADVNQIDRRLVTGDPFSEDGCYFHPPDTGFARTVGTVFNPVLEQNCGPSNADCPFGDDFEDAVASGQQWSFGGATGIVDGELVFPSSGACSDATITIEDLVPGESYIIDYDWRAASMFGDQPLVTVDIGAPGASFYTLAPCRLIDTRNPAGPQGGPALSAGADRDFTLAGLCSIPPTARAVAVNIAVTQPTSQGNLRLYPAGTPLPLVSSVNYEAGQTVGNAAIVPLSVSGAIAVRCSQAAGTTHFILDVNGYFK